MSTTLVGLPRLVFRPTFGVASALTKLTQGARNSVAPDEKVRKHLCGVVMIVSFEASI
jgi:hypothetical protein